MKMPWSADDGKAETVLNQGTEFTGSVRVKGPVHIHGLIDGDVHCEDHLVIGREGVVRGNVSARLVSISGRVDGRVDAVERVELLDTANLTGEIFCPRFTVVDGAIFEGYVHMAEAVVEPMTQIGVRRVEQIESRAAPAPVPSAEAEPAVPAGAAEAPNAEEEKDGDREEKEEPQDDGAPAKAGHSARAEAAAKPEDKPVHDPTARPPVRPEPKVFSRAGSAGGRRSERQPPPSSAVIKG